MADGVRMSHIGGGDYCCGVCQGAVPVDQVRASAVHPLGETDCPHCGARVAKLDHASWRGWLRMTLLLLGVLGSASAIRQWPDGTWWPYALVFATSLGALVYLRFQFRQAERVLLPVARY